MVFFVKTRNQKKSIIIAIFFLGLAFESHAQQAEVTKVTVSIDSAKKQNLKHAIDVLLDELNLRGIKTYSSSDAKTICIPRHDTLLYVTAILNEEKNGTRYFAVKLRTAVHSRREPEFERIYQMYVDLTIDRLGKGQWDYYAPKKLPIDFNGYRFLLIEEYIENSVGGVIKLYSNSH